MNYRETMDELKTTSGRVSIAVAVASAERVFPVIKHLGSVRTAVLVRRLIDLMWRAAQEGHALASIEAGELRNLDESEIDDSHHQLHGPMRALGVVDCAMKAMASATGHWAEETCGSECDLLQDIEVYAEGRSADELSNKLLEEMSLDLEQGQREAGIAQVRARAELWAQMVASLLPAFARRRGIVFTP